MANKILPKRGTRSALTTLAGSASLTPYELLFVTDEGRLEVVTSSSTSVTMAKVSDISTAGKTGSYTDLTNKPTIPSGTVTSVALSVPTGLSIAGSPVTSSGTLAITYAAGYQGYTSAEATKLSGIASGATANTGTVTSVGISAPTGLTAGSAVTTSGNISLTWTAGYQGYTSAEAALVSGALQKSGGTMSGGISMGSAVAASATDVSRHLALYAASYGFSVTSSTLNHVSGGAHNWYSGATLRMALDSAGNLSAASFTGSVAISNIADGTIGANGFAGTEVNDGSKSGVTYTPSQSGSNFRQATNGGAFTLAAPAAATVSIVLRLINSATAGAVTMSGFHNVIGDSFDTTNGSQFMIFLTNSGGLKLANVVKVV